MKIYRRGGQKWVIFKEIKFDLKQVVGGHGLSLALSVSAGTKSICKDGLYACFVLSCCFCPTSCLCSRHICACSGVNLALCAVCYLRFNARVFELCMCGCLQQNVNKPLLFLPTRLPQTRQWQLQHNWQRGVFAWGRKGGQLIKKEWSI